MGVYEHGSVAAATLKVLRPVVDEIVVAFDSRTPEKQLGPLESVADALVGFEFTGANRFRPWLREQARGDWLLMLDGDEVPSAQLLNALPKLILRKDISGYLLQCWWMFPDSSRRLITPPWEEDRGHLRLARNDGRLWFPGVKHSGAVCDGPIRFVDAPIIHLNLIIQSEVERADKVRHYDHESFPIFTFEGRLINESFYLPEHDLSARTTLVPLIDATRVSTIIAKKDEVGFAPKKPAEIVPAAEVEKWWTGRPCEPFDYRADIEVVRGEVLVPIRATTKFDLDVTNMGTNVWFASDLSRGAPPIHLSYHWTTADAAVAVFDGRRTKLTSRILPGERVRAIVMVDTPPEAGRYKLTFDLVREGVRWFGIDREIEIDVEVPSFDLLGTIGGSRLISLSSARAARRRLRDVNGLARILRPENEGVEPPLGIEPDGMQMHGAALNFLLAWLRRGKFMRILEFGSGVSTVVIAREIAPHCGRLLSVEQNEIYAASTKKLLSENCVGDAAKVVTSTLGETNAGGLRTQCYKIDSDIATEIGAFDPDFILIDGPSQVSDGFRLAIAPSLLPLLKRRAPFVMDDACRDAELEVGVRWQREPQIRVDGIVIVGRGLLIGHLRCDLPT